MHISALPFSAKYAPANSQAQDIDPLVLRLEYHPQLCPGLAISSNYAKHISALFPKVASYWSEFIA